MSLMCENRWTPRCCAHRVVAVSYRLPIQVIYVNFSSSHRSSLDRNEVRIVRYLDRESRLTQCNKELPPQYPCLIS